MKVINPALGEALKTALPEGRGSQAWLAGQLQMSGAAIHYWINGEREPRPEMLAEICILLELEIESIIQLTSYNQRQQGRFRTRHRVLTQKST